MNKNSRTGCLWLNPSKVATRFKFTRRINLTGNHFGHGWSNIKQLASITLASKGYSGYRVKRMRRVKIRCSHYEWWEGRDATRHSSPAGNEERERGPLVESRGVTRPSALDWTDAVSDPRWKRIAVYSFTTYQRVENKQHDTKVSSSESENSLFSSTWRGAGQRFSIDKSGSINDINEDVPISVITGRLRGYFINRCYSIVNINLFNRQLLVQYVTDKSMFVQNL